MQAGTQYNVRVRAYINSFVGNYGTTCLIGIVSGAREEFQIEGENESIENVSISLNMNLYPNPANFNSTLEITSGITEPAELNIFDMAGRLVHSETVVTNEKVIIAEGLNLGIYLVRVTTQSGEQNSARLVKN